MFRWAVHTPISPVAHATSCRWHRNCTGRRWSRESPSGAAPAPCRPTRRGPRRPRHVSTSPTRPTCSCCTAGPFTDRTQACPDRPASPADAFVKPTDPGMVGTFLACLCPAHAYDHHPPDITEVGQQGCWVGELQRALGADLNFDVGNVNADPATGTPVAGGSTSRRPRPRWAGSTPTSGFPPPNGWTRRRGRQLQNAWCGYPGEGLAAVANSVTPAQAGVTGARRVGGCDPVVSRADARVGLGEGK